MARIGVIGGGAAGLAAAWTALQNGHEVELFDSNPDLGGRCRTHLWEGEWIIRGAAAFIGGESEIVALCRAAEIYDPDNIESSKEEMEFTVLHPDKGYAYLGGFDVPSILRASVIPLAEKARLGLALPKLISAFAAANESDPTSVVKLDDVNACEYFRQYSPAFVDYVLEPVMNMYCGYSEADFSLAWLGWLMASPRSWSASQWTFADRGVGKLTHALQQKLDDHPQCTIHLSAPVTRVEQSETAVNVHWRDENSQFDGVVMAIPGSLVPDIVHELPDDFMTFFRQVEYVPHHIVHMVIDRPADEVPFSLLLPTCEGYRACSNAWLKPMDDHSDKTLFYAEVKGAFGREHRNSSDEFILDAVWEECARAIPELASCNRYQQHLQRNDIALCSRRKGYTTELKKFRSLKPLSRMRFAGDYLINSTVGQAARSGMDAAQSLGHDLRAIDP